jgi:NACalpha-BTF3-like transcription factor
MKKRRKGMNQLLNELGKLLEKLENVNEIIAYTDDKTRLYIEKNEIEEEINIIESQLIC